MRQTIYEPSRQEVVSMGKRTSGPLAAKLAKAFQAIATGLTLPSESDFPFMPRIATG